MHTLGVDTMAKTLFSYSRKDKIIEYRLTFSKDWNTLTPWSVDGKIVPYFSKVVQTEGPAKVTSYVIGPFLIQVGEVA